MNDPNKRKKQVIDLIQQNLHLSPDQRQFWQLFVAYRAKPEQLQPIGDFFAQFPTKTTDILARQLGMSAKNQKIANAFVTEFGQAYKQVKTTAHTNI